MPLIADVWIFISDINECFEELDECHANANCSNVMGSYTCQCIEGFTGDGRNCQGRHTLI